MSLGHPRSPNIFSNQEILPIVLLLPLAKLPLLCGFYIPTCSIRACSEFCGHGTQYSTFHSTLCREQHEILAFVAHPCSFPDVWVIIDHLIVDQLPTSYSQYECFAFIANFLLLCA